ncbi:MAG: hypothetical protein HKO90_00015 [Flavobacteriaceae bacterium]|nr:hypothetical protein [Bacteroidia bacterium]NNK86639.1 hypothetical protein [Flavobacteriaceae bacterium]
MFRIYLIGIGILILAIIANFLAGKLGLKTWYDLFNALSGSSDLTLASFGIMDYIWLILIYPLFLGLGYVIGDKLFNALFG